MCRGLAWSPLLCSTCPVLGSCFRSFKKLSRESPGSHGGQREKDVVLTALHLLPALGRGHRDSGQPEITRAGGGGGGYCTQGWAGPAGMRWGRAI